MQSHGQGQQQTGTRNETYDVISVLYHALQGAENCRIYAQDANDDRIRDFLQRALQVQRQLADEGKQVLQQCLHKDTGGESAFGWGSSHSQGSAFGEQGSSFGQGQSGGSTSGSQSHSAFSSQSTEHNISGGNS
jgi:hypothetical protein